MAEKKEKKPRKKRSDFGKKRGKRKGIKNPRLQTGSIDFRTIGTQQISNLTSLIGTMASLSRPIIQPSQLNIQEMISTELSKYAPRDIIKVENIPHFQPDIEQGQEERPFVESAQESAALKLQRKAMSNRVQNLRKEVEETQLQKAEAEKNLDIVQQKIVRQQKQFAITGKKNLIETVNGYQAQYLKQKLREMGEEDIEGDVYQLRLSYLKNKGLKFEKDFTVGKGNKGALKMIPMDVEDFEQAQEEPNNELGDLEARLHQTMDIAVQKEQELSGLYKTTYAMEKELEEKNTLLEQTQNELSSMKERIDKDIEQGLTVRDEQLKQAESMKRLLEENLADLRTQNAELKANTISKAEFEANTKGLKETIKKQKQDLDYVRKEIAAKDKMIGQQQIEKQQLALRMEETQLAGEKSLVIAKQENEQKLAESQDYTRQIVESIRNTMGNRIQRVEEESERFKQQTEFQRDQFEEERQSLKGEIIRANAQADLMRQYANQQEEEYNEEARVSNIEFEKLNRNLAKESLFSMFFERENEKLKRVELQQKPSYEPGGASMPIVAELQIKSQKLIENEGFLSKQKQDLIKGSNYLQKPELKRILEKERIDIKPTDDLTDLRIIYLRSMGLKIGEDFNLKGREGARGKASKEFDLIPIIKQDFQRVQEERPIVEIAELQED